MSAGAGVRLLLFDDRAGAPGRRCGAARDAGAYDPTAHDGVRRVLKGLGRQAAGRGRQSGAGQSPLPIAPPCWPWPGLPRRSGRGRESEAAAERGAVDKANVGLLFQGGLRRRQYLYYPLPSWEASGRRTRMDITKEAQRFDLSLSVVFDPESGRVCYTLTDSTGNLGKATESISEIAVWIEGFAHCKEGGKFIVLDSGGSK